MNREILTTIGGGALSVCALASAAFAQDSTSITSTFPGDTLLPHDTTEQVNDYVLDVSTLTSSSGRTYGIAPLAKTSADSDPGSVDYGALMGAHGISNNTGFGVPFARSSYMSWNGPGLGVNGNAAVNAPGTPVNTAASVGNQFGFTFAEFSTNQVNLNALNQVIGGTVNYDVATPSRLYVSRVGGVTNSPDQFCDLAQFGMGGVTNTGKILVRADGFGSGPCAPFTELTTNNYFRVDLLARNAGVVNMINSAGAVDLGATLQPLAGSATTHSPAAMVSGDLNGGTPLFLGSNFNGELVYGSIAATGTTAHVGGASTRGTVSYSQHQFPFFGATVGTGAQLMKSAGTATDSMATFGVSGGGSPSGNVILTLPAAISDPTDGFTTLGAYEFGNYFSATPFRGSNGPIAIGKDQQGRMLAAAESVHGTGATTDADNLIAVARYNGTTTEWTVAAHTTGTGGKDVYGSFGSSVIGHLVGTDAGGLLPGPSLGSPMMDSRGNIYFSAHVELTGAGFFENALVRAIYDEATFSYKLELVVSEGDVVRGGNSGVNYQVRFLSVGGSSGPIPSSTWSHGMNQNAYNLTDPALIDQADTEAIGGIVLAANIIYDVDNDGNYDPLTTNPGSLDQDYNVLLYVTSAEDCNDNGIPDDLDIADGTSNDIDLDGKPDECAGGFTGTLYCFGDGTGTICPCGNPGLAGEGCANGTGSGGILLGTGSESVGADDLVFNASQLPAGQPALLFNGLNQVNGGQGTLFGDGLRCAGGSVKRMGVKVATGGNASYGPALSAAGQYGAGDTRSFQVWYRDPAGSPCGSFFNLTNGVTVSFIP